MSIKSFVFLPGSELPPLGVNAEIIADLNTHQESKPSSIELRFGWIDAIKWTKERGVGYLTLKDEFCA